MLKSKISGVVQEVVLPDFPDDDNTVTTTVTKSRRVSFGTNFVKEFIVGSAVSAQCMSEYEQAFPSSDSSNADSSHSAAEILDQCKFAMPENVKIHKVASTVNQSVESESVENRPKPPKFSRTICFNADSPTADMEFTEGCITLAKSILDKKNKEMTVIIQAVPKEPKEEEKPKEEETKYFDASQFEMSMTKCLKSKENKREEKKFESEKTKIFTKFEDEMSITRCNKIFNDDESDCSWSNCKENLMPLDMIMRHLDKDNSDFENDLFNPKKSFNNFLNSNPFDFSNDSEKLDLNESMDISTDFHPNVFNESQKTTLPDGKLNENKSIGSDLSEKIISNDLMEISGEFQSDLSKIEENPLSFKKQNIDESKKICMDLQPDIHETFQNSVKSDEAIDFTKADKSDNPEKVFPNVAVEIIADNAHVDEALEVSLQSEDRVIEDKLMNSKKNYEVNSMESMEICEEFRVETRSLQLPETVNLSSFGEEICNNKSVNFYSFENESVNESVNVSNSFQSDIRKDSEDLHLQGNPNDNELLKNRRMVEDFKFSEDIQINIVEASEETFSPREICNEKAGVNEFEKPTHNQHPEVPEEYETLPPANQIISDKPTELSVSEETDTSMKCIADYQPQNGEKIVSEEVCNQFELLNEDEALEISTAEADVSALSEKSPLNEENADEVELNDLEKHNSENAMEIIADNQSNALETIENPPPTEAVAVNNSYETRTNEPVKFSADQELSVPGLRQNSPPENQIRKSAEFNSSNDTDEVPTWNREPSLVDIKMIESLREQSKEPGCIWSLKDLRYPQGKTSGLLSFTCELLESVTTIYFYLETSEDDRLDSCSIIKSSEINLNEERHCRLPEYGLVIGFGFREMKKFFDERRKKVETIRHIPYFLDQINSFLLKMNSYLRQIHSILTLYPGSRLKDSTISFRLYSFPIFFSCVVSIDLTDLFRLSKSSLSFENDFGTLDENKIRDIFQKCLKNENSLCEFVVQSTNYLFDIEKKSGYVSKRRHIRLLPVDLKL